MSERVFPVLNHLTADFMGVPAEQLRDSGMLSGLLIAAAGAAGITTRGAPRMQTMPDEHISGWLQLEDCHIAVHAFPERELLLLDVLSAATHDVSKAMAVFARRLLAREVRSEQRQRG